MLARTSLKLLGLTFLTLIAAKPAVACPYERTIEDQFGKANELISKGIDPAVAYDELVSRLKVTFPACDSSAVGRTVAAHAYAQYANMAKDATVASNRANTAWAHYSAARTIMVKPESWREDLDQLLDATGPAILNIMLHTEAGGLPRGMLFFDPLLHDCFEAGSFSRVALEWTGANGSYSEAAHWLIDNAVAQCRPKFIEKGRGFTTPLITQAIFYTILAQSTSEPAKRASLVKVVESNLAENFKIYGQDDVLWTKAHQEALDKLKASSPPQ